MSRMAELYHEATVADALGYQPTGTALRETIAELTRQRDALACVLRAVPVHAHNEAVILSDCNILDYTHAMEATA